LTVEIVVGTTSIFRVHEDVLRQSPYFVNALKPEWRAAREGKPIGLEDEDPDIFAGYVQWLYTHQVDTKFNTVKRAEMYVLGEVLMDNAFQNAVLGTMIRRVEAKHHYPIGEEIDIIYNGTNEGSPARRLLVDYYVWGAGSSWVKGYDMANTRPTDFINNLLLALVTRRPALCLNGKGEKTWISDVSKYFIKPATPEAAKQEKTKTDTTKST
jgi:hypothetical protein